MSSLPTYIAIPITGPLIAAFGPVAAGSCAEWSMFFEDEVSDGVWEPMSFVGVTLLAQVRRSLYDPDPIAGGCSVAEGEQLGTLNFFIGSDITAANPDIELHFGFKIIPDHVPTRARVHVVGVIPVVRTGVQ